MAEMKKHLLHSTKQIDEAVIKVQNIYSKSEIDSLLNNKVGAETGKGLSSNDYTTEEKNKLANIDNYDDTEIKAKLFVNKSTIGYEKRNYLENNASSRERYGIMATVNDDGSITLNGTNTAGSSFMLFSNLQTGATPEGSQFSNNKKWIPTGEYIMSQGGVSGVTLQIRYAEEPNSEGNYYSCSTSEQTITIGEQYNYVWCRILISSGASFDNTVLYPMIRLSNDADSSYVKYQPTVFEQIIENKELTSDKLGSYGSYITNNANIPDNISDVKDIPPNRIMVFGGSVTSEGINNLPEYGKAIYIVKFHACPYGDDSLYYMIAVNTLGKMWYSAYSVGKEISWERVITGESVDYLGTDMTKIVNQNGIEYWCQKGYGVYLNDETFDSLGITKLTDIPKNTTISSNGAYRGLSESNISGLPVYNTNVTISRISGLPERTGEDLSRTIKDASGILDMFLAMWEENGKPVMKYCFAKSSTTTTEWCGILSDNNRKENAYGINMFEKIGVIGDSISCGWGFDKNGNRSRRNLKVSWVQQMARRLGCTAYNLGASGVDPVEWFQPNFEFAEYCYTQYQSTDECDLYIVGLGLNQATLGTIADINETDYTQNASTFYGQYARIIQTINADHPDAIVMCLTEPTTRISSYDTAVREICNSGKVNALLVDLERDYLDLFNTEELKSQYQSDNLHFTPYGYSLIADSMIRAINDFISKNTDKFKFVGITEV